MAQSYNDSDGPSCLPPPTPRSRRPAAGCRMDLLLSEVAARTQITKLNNTNRKWAMVVILCTSVFASLQMVHVLLPRRSPARALRCFGGRGVW